MNHVGVFMLMGVAVAGIIAHNPLLDDGLAAVLQKTMDDWMADLRSGNVSDRKLAKVYDPQDVKQMLPNTPTFTSAQAIIDGARALTANYPPDVVFKGVQVEAYSYKYKGRKYANSLCRSVGRDGAGNVLFIFRASQIWRQFGKKWRMHRDNANLECLGNCAQD